jgi:hypothetical protein
VYKFVCVLKVSIYKEYNDSLSDMDEYNNSFLDMDNTAIKDSFLVQATGTDKWTCYSTTDIFCRTVTFAIV